jgi:hypothetical protein
MAKQLRRHIRSLKIVVDTDTGEVVSQRPG